MNALYVDKYCLTMAQSFWRHEQNEVVSFELFVRTLPRNRDFLLVAGINPALEYLRDYAFTAEDIDYLRAEGTYEDGFLGFLEDLRFTGSVDAVPEGTVIGPGEPILRVTAPRIEASLVESALLTIINHETMVASKAARIVAAAKGRPVFDFSLRRLHGYAASLGTARAAYIAGCVGTATMEAGKKFGIPTLGTMAHHYLGLFGREREVEAFSQFLRDYPENGVLLVDTYDVHEGVRNAIRAGKATGIQPKGIRLDSGDLAKIAKWARAELDAAGYEETTIVASNDLDEYRIKELVDANAPIDAFGVGTRLGTSEDHPSLGGVYKIVMQEQDGKHQPVMKFSESKSTDPGVHQTFRVVGEEVVDRIAMQDEQLPGTPLMCAGIRDGEIVDAYTADLDEIRARAEDELVLVQEKKIVVARSPELLSLIAVMKQK